MEKQKIHIHAKCNAFEIFEVVDADKAVARLKQIKGMSKNRPRIPNFPRFGPATSNDKLVVNTRIINPTLFSA